MSVFDLHHGNRDVIELLERTLEEARSGTLEAVIIIGCSTDGRGGWAGAMNDGMQYPWARLQAMLDTAHMELLRDGTAGWV